MLVKINEQISLDVEQIKISGALIVGGVKIPAGMNKTLDSGIISKLPTEIVEQLTEEVFDSLVQKPSEEVEEIVAEESLKSAQ